LLDGGMASALSGVASVRHRQGKSACSGVLIAPNLVLTARHCVFSLDAIENDSPFEAAGFRVGFGADESVSMERGVERVIWSTSPALSIATAVARGEDVALLQLAEQAPAAELVHELDLRFVPTAEQPVLVSGFGLTSLERGTAGVRSVGDGRVSGFDSATGIAQISGPQVCYGDSGGPVIAQVGRTVFGVIGQIGVNGPKESCGLAITFASTTSNDAVRRLISRACGAVGGCGSREPLADDEISDASINEADSSRDAMDPVDAEPDTSAEEAPQDMASDALRHDDEEAREAKRAPGCGVRIAPSSSLRLGLWSIVLLLFIRKRTL
jgi:hypothetical protein